MSDSDSDSPASKPKVDFEQLQAASDGDLGLMRELADMYFQQAGEIMAALDKAIVEKSVAQVDHQAHKLAGSSLACGFSAIVPFLRHLEHNAKAGHLEGAEGFNAEAKIQLEAIRQCVQDYFAKGLSQAG